MSFEPGQHVLLYEAEILRIVNELAQKIGSEFRSSGEQELVLVCVLESARTLTLELQKALQKMGIDATITYIKASSYGKTKVSSGKPTYTISEGDIESLRQKYVWIVDDMFDTGNTLRGLIDLLANKEIVVNIVVLLKKIKDVSEANLAILNRIVFGIATPNLWVHGYGIDSDEEHREDRDISAVITTEEQHYLWLLFRAMMKKLSNQASAPAEQSASTM